MPHSIKQELATAQQQQQQGDKTGFIEYKCTVCVLQGAEVVDVAICWNYLVVGDTSGITKYGLVNNKPCLERYQQNEK